MKIKYEPWTWARVIISKSQSSNMKLPISTTSNNWLKPNLHSMTELIFKKNVSTKMEEAEFMTYTAASL